MIDRAGLVPAARAFPIRSSGGVGTALVRGASG